MFSPAAPRVLSAVTLAVALVLTGCSAGTDAPSAAAPPASSSSPATSSSVPASPSASPASPSAADPTAEAPVTAAPPSGTVLELTYLGGVAGGPDTGRPDVAAGQPVTLRITSDVAEEVHVHGVDLYVDLVAGQQTELTFDPPPPGIYEVEAHDTGVVLTNLAVR